MNATSDPALIEPSDDTDNETASGAGLYAPPCFTTAAFEAERDPARLPLFMPPERRWLAALLDAIGSPVFPDSGRTAALWRTDWGQDGQEGNAPEHDHYLAYVKAFTAQRMPWLLSLLDGARALVAVRPGTYTFLVDNYPGDFMDIPELVPYTYLLPWTTDEERKARH